MFPDAPVVSISDSQRKPLRQANWVRTVHHGLPADLLAPQPVQPRYLAFLGRIAPEKQADAAIRIAQSVGQPLKIAAKVDRADRDYFDEKIKHLLDGPGIDFIGEIGDKDKSTFLSGAKALLLPIDWPEPFGLVMIEAMACGTPVIAFNRGSVPEIIEDGLTGFVVNNEAEAAEALARIPQLSRNAIRKRFEERFTARRMAIDYVEAYEELIGEEEPQRRLAAV
jgi:glycosyltransferase involved in cell wall biosynthesis